MIDATDHNMRLAANCGLSLQQVELGLALMRTGRTDLIAEVIAGKMNVERALTTARKSKSKPGQT
jgi:hypothetical protein